MTTDESWFEDSQHVYIESLDLKIKVLQINETISNNSPSSYSIGIGDQLSVTVWGLPDVFPIVSINTEQLLRTVNTDGTIFFPYVGSIVAAGKNQSQFRAELTNELSKYFNNPQLDVTIARFNSQKVYMLGEVTKPMKISITETPLSLTDSIGQVNGINTNTANGSEVFIIRQGQNGNLPEIIRADLDSPSGFIIAGNFYLKNQDIVYVNAKGTIRWNRVISQFFPFSSFLNSVDNLIAD